MRVMLGVISLAVVVLACGGDAPTTDAESIQDCSVGATCDLPPAVCVDGTTVREFESGVCIDGGCSFTSVDSTCPAGGTCTDGACTCTEACIPFELAVAQGRLRQVVVDEAYVYWGTQNGARRILRRPKDGGAVEPIAPSGEVVMPEGMALDHDHVYWVDSSTNQIARWSKSGGDYEMLANTSDGVSQPARIALDETHFYWTNAANDGPNGSVLRRAKSETGGGVETIVNGPDALRAIALAIDSTHVYWGAGTTNGALRKRSKLGGTIETIVSGINIGAIAVDATHVYFTTAHNVLRREKVGGPIETIATGDDGESANALVLDHDRVYWTTTGGFRDSDKTSVRSRAKAGGPVEILASQLETTFPLGLTVDHDYVYWTTDPLFTDAGRVMRLSRCGCGL